MIKEPLISVIVPVYNVEPYLQKCVDSVLNQSFQNFELILVDDGSIDNSGKICNEYALKDKRIKVIHQKNSGLSTARNNGFKITKGDYICFLDSDDWYSKNALEVLFNIIKNNEVEISMIKLVETNTENISFERKKGVKILSSDDCINSLKKEHSNYVTPCNKLYKRELLEKLKFPEGIIFEDFHIIIERYSQIKQLGYSEEACMFYRQRDGSICRSKFSIKSLQYVDALEHVTSKLSEMNKKDILYYFSNKLLDSYMEYSLKLYDSDLSKKKYYINKYRINSKKLFKSLPLYRWKPFLIKRYFFYLLSLKFYRLYINLKYINKNISFKF